MLKKSRLNEKLKKLKIEGPAKETPPPEPKEVKTAELAKETPAPESKKPLEVEKTVVETQEQKVRKGIRQKIKGIRIKPPIKRHVSKSDQPITKSEEKPPEPDLKADGRLLKAKSAAEIEDKKPVDLIESLIPEKRTLTFISDLAIPSHKLSKVFKVETSYTEKTLTQILTAWKDDNKVIKWTAKLDKHGEEFYSLKGEGLMKMKNDPPIYGLEFEDGAVIATHMGDYTFIMGCYNFDVKSLVKIFAFGIDNAKQFDL